MNRREFRDRSFRGGELCAAGAMMALLFLLNPSTPGRAAQFLFFWFLAWLSGKRNRPLLTLSVMLGVVLFNLIVPYGRVLAEWGPLRITAGSLEGGVRKAVTLEGLIMLSAAVMRGDLPLPGPLGSLLGESFRLLEKFRERPLPAGGRDLIAALDEILLEFSAPGDLPAGNRPPAPRPWPGRFLLLAAVLITGILGLAGEKLAGLSSLH